MLILSFSIVRASVRAVESTVTVKEGEEARLECEVHGNPQPTISWEKQVDFYIVPQLDNHVDFSLSISSTNLNRKLLMIRQGPRFSI